MYFARKNAFYPVKAYAFTTKYDIIKTKFGEEDSNNLPMTDTNQRAPRIFAEGFCFSL